MKQTVLRTLFITSILTGCTDKSQSHFEALSSPSPELIKQIEPYIQPSIDFIVKNEKYALENGIELSADEKKLAKKIGVRNVDKVRVVLVKELPFPDDEILGEWAKSHGLDSPKVIGFTHGYGVYIKHGNRRILPHELVHVRQFEQLGIEALMRRYILELTVMGYRYAPLEVQAYNEAKMFRPTID